MRTEFFMAMIPPSVTYQEKQVTVRSGKPIFYEPKELEAARAKLEAHLAKHVPEVKYTKACRAIVKWCFPITGNHYDGEYKDTKPDTHNLDKMLFDIMEDLGYWDNDARVASEIIEKFYADIPGIYICIEGPLNRGDTNG
jgi:Holliday junction resolvase RusA-like endonuclease